MKIKEFTRKPRVKIYSDTPATHVRALMRDNDEPIAILVSRRDIDLFEGYVTWTEAIQITSHYSILRAKDISLNHPIAHSGEEVEDVAEKMEKERVVAVPVVESMDNPRVIGVVSLSDIVGKLLEQGYTPLAETVAEALTTDNLDDYIVYSGDRVNRAWSRLVYRRIPGLVVLRSRAEPVPVGIVTPRELLRTSRWYFHRESEHGLKSIARVRTIMLRGAPAASPETPIEYVARLMAENNFTALPVIDEETKKVVGVITLHDVLRAYITGAKPGRVKPVKKPLLPILVKPEERPVYVSTGRVLEQVLTAKAPVEELMGLTAGDIARPSLPAVSVNDTLEHARRMMVRYRTNYLLVVDDRGEIVGAVTKWSMLKALGLMGPIWRRRIDDKLFIEYVMTKDLPRVGLDSSIEEAALRMVESKSEIVLVVDENGWIKGFITKDDLVDAYERVLKERARVENVMTPRMLGVVHPHHSLSHAISKMTTFYIDALAVYDGSKVLGVVSANRLPFMAYEDSLVASKSRYVIWVRRVKEKGLKKARYIKVTPLLVLDAMIRLPPDTYVKTSDDVVEAIKLMKKHVVDGVPVVDEEDRVAGVIAKNDVVRELARTARLRIERGLPVTVDKRRKKKSGGSKG